MDVCWTDEDEAFLGDEMVMCVWDVRSSCPFLHMENLGMSTTRMMVMLQTYDGYTQSSDRQRERQAANDRILFCSISLSTEDTPSPIQRN